MGKVNAAGKAPVRPYRGRRGEVRALIREIVAGVVVGGLVGGLVGAALAWCYGADPELGIGGLYWWLAG